jgi:hypothetical protein
MVTLGNISITCNMEVLKHEQGQRELSMHIREPLARHSYFCVDFAMSQHVSTLPSGHLQVFSHYVYLQLSVQLP